MSIVCAVFSVGNVHTVSVCAVFVVSNVHIMPCVQCW